MTGGDAAGIDHDDVVPLGCDSVSPAKVARSMLDAVATTGWSVSLSGMPSKSRLGDGFDHGKDLAVAQRRQQEIAAAITPAEDTGAGDPKAMVRMSPALCRHDV